MSGYTHVQDGRTLEVFSVLTLREPGCAGISMGRDQFVHVDAPKVEEVCAALREAAGLPPVWTVEKQQYREENLCGHKGVQWGPSMRLGASTDQARVLAARLLAAADEAEARANRPKLPTAVRSMIQVDDTAWVRSGRGWNRVEGAFAWAPDAYMASRDFTVLYDPEAEGGA
jgi:hypothetical protein